ncbi:MAG: iron-containing alcohol dehydrogenase family protein [Pseudomonadota bacterium]
MRPTKTVGTYLFGRGCLDNLKERVTLHAPGEDDCVVYFIDHFWRANEKMMPRLPARNKDVIQFVDTTHEPKTDQVDDLKIEVVTASEGRPIKLIVGIGGGATLDIAKAVANLLTNEGKAADYQGWDLVKNPAVKKIGIPTLSGTGAEASATCVMLNRAKNLKLGMNSIHTVYDELLLDPDLTASVPREQYFYTGMDTYIHCIESLAGSYRHAIADSYSRQSLELARQVFLSDDMQSDQAREAMMIASYLGGSAIGNSFVGVVHPFSAGLSVVFGTHHCLANCLVMNAMQEFYPEETKEFHEMLKKQKIRLPVGICSNVTDEEMEKLYASTIIHEKPLRNALGDNFKDILTPAKVAQIFRRM